MTVAEAIRLFKLWADDRADPPLWDDEDNIIPLLSFAQREACRRGMLIRDDTTEEVCEIWFNIETDRYNLHPSIIAIADDPNAVSYRNEALIRMHGPREHQFVTTPNKPFSYWDNGKQLIIWPIPLVEDFEEPIRLDVYRLPLTDITDIDSEFEVPDEFMPGVVAGALSFGFLKTDADSSNAGLQKKWEAEFVSWFGKRIDADVLRNQRDKTPRIVKQNWFNGSPIRRTGVRICSRNGW